MTKRYEEFDILRGLAIIGVILIHITSTTIDYSTEEFSEGFAIFVNQLMRFAVPVFFFLSGFGLTVSNKLSDGYFQFLYKRLSKIIYLYLGWSIIYYAYTVDSISPMTFIKQTVLGSNYFHLYYVPLIIAFYLAFPALQKIGKSTLGLLIVLTVTVLSQIGTETLGIQLLNHESNIFNWAFYFVFGIWFAGNLTDKIIFIKNNKKVLVVSFSLVLTAVFLESYMLFDEIGKSGATTSMRPTIILLTILFVAMIISIDWKEGFFKKTVKRLSEWSYGIYLSHALVLAIYLNIFEKAGWDVGSVWYIITAFIVVTPISIAITIFVDWILAKIEGKRSNKVSNKIAKSELS